MLATFYYFLKIELKFENLKKKKVVFKNFGFVFFNLAYTSTLLLKKDTKVLLKKK